MKFCKHEENRKIYFLNGKKTCPTCDVLLIDIEIECDEEKKSPRTQKEKTLVTLSSNQ